MPFCTLAYFNISPYSCYCPFFSFFLHTWDSNPRHFQLGFTHIYWSAKVFFLFFFSLCSLLHDCRTDWICFLWTAGWQKAVLWVSCKSFWFWGAEFRQEIRAAVAGGLTTDEAGRLTKRSADRQACKSSLTQNLQTQGQQGQVADAEVRKAGIQELWRSRGLWRKASRQKACWSNLTTP